MVLKQLFFKALLLHPMFLEELLQHPEMVPEVAFEPHSIVFVKEHVQQVLHLLTCRIDDWSAAEGVSNVRECVLDDVQLEEPRLVEVEELVGL